MGVSLSSMKRTVYIETSIPSFFYDVRTVPAAVARRESTRQWWEEERPWCELYTSELVLEELRRGDYPGKADALELMENLPRLEDVQEIEWIIKTYVRNHLMPGRNIADAHHLAVTSYYGIHFLLTWNCRHLANANKVDHLRSINNDLGLYVPKVTTPDNLIFEEIDDDR